MAENDSKDLILDSEEYNSGNNINAESSNDDGLSSGNIFDDFSLDDSLIKDVNQMKKEESKDFFYYISLTGKILQHVTIVLGILVLLCYGYVYIQKNPNISDNSIMDTVCFLFSSSDVPIADGTTYCSSVAFNKTFYEGKLNTVKTEQAKKILTNLVVIYERQNFLKSKDILFLFDKSANRLAVIEILEKFHSMKKEFLLEKSRILCSNIRIDGIENTMEMSCKAYSQNYETNSIVGFAGEVGDEEAYVSGTSISVANSFLNYIEKNSTDFTLLDRQKLFSINEVASDDENGKTMGYTYSTSFTLKLKINF